MPEHEAQPVTDGLRDRSRLLLEQFRQFHLRTCEFQRCEPTSLKFWQYEQHVCGLTGYGLHPDDVCRGCLKPPTVRDPECTCGLLKALAALLAVPPPQEAPEDEKDSDSRVDRVPETPALGSTAKIATGDKSPMTEDEVIERTVRIMRDLHDLKEDVLFGGGIQPDFDAGMIEAALAILRANIDDEDPRVVAEMHRQCNVRLLRALGEPASRFVAVDPADGLGQEGSTREKGI